MKTKLTIDASQWRKALAQIAPVINNKSALPILGSVVMKYDEGRNVFTMTASDSEAWITIDCIDQDGKPWINMLEDDDKDKFTEVAIPFAQLREAVNLLPAAQLLQVTFTEAKMDVNYGIGEFAMAWQSAAEFPQPLPVAGKDAEGAVCRFTLDAEKLLPMMSAAIESSADDELRMVMNGVCLDTYHDKLVVAATNGRELFKDIIETGLGWLEYATFPAFNQETQQVGSAKLLVTKRTRRLLAGAVTGGPITVTADVQRIEFKARGVSIVARLIEGNFPNYEAVIPKDGQFRVTLCREALRQALRRLRLFADEGSQLASLKREGNSFMVQSADQSYGKSGQERVDIVEQDTFMPEDFHIGFNIGIAIGILDRIQTENVVLILSAANKAFLYRNDDAHSGRLLLQMPMRTE